MKKQCNPKKSRTRGEMSTLRTFLFWFVITNLHLGIDYSVDINVDGAVSIHDQVGLKKQDDA